MGVILTATAALVKETSATASAEVMMRRFGEKLRALRLKRGLTMRALADVLGLKSHGFIGDLESGRKHPSLELAVTLADYFGVSVDQLARDELEIES
jgi:transcriptional regulator with XRE-family HTH domain